MAVKYSHWFRRRFPLPDSATYNNHSFISMNAHVRPEEFCFLEFGTRERGRGNRTKWLSKTAIDSVAASRFPLPDSATYNNHSFISMNANVRPEEFCFLEFGTRERGRGNRAKWLSNTAIGSVAASRFP